MRRGARDIIIPASGGGTAATAGDGYNIIAAGSQTANTTGTVVFSNSNGLVFGMSNNSVVTGSYTVPTVTNSSVSLSDSVTAVTLARLAFTGSNGLTLTLSTGAGGSHTLVGSYTVPTVTNSSMTVSDAATSGTLARLAFTNLNGVTLSLSSGAGGSHTIVGSHNGLTSQSTDFNAITLGGNTAGTTTFHATNNRTIFLHGGNNITLSGNGSSITVVGPSTSAQTNQTLGWYASSNTTGESSSTTFDARSISFIGKGVASVGFSGSQVIISVPSGGAGDGGNTLAAGTRTATSNGIVKFADSNGLVFGLDAVNGTQITASYTVPTVPAQTVESQSIGMNTSTAGGGTAGTSGYASGGQIRYDLYAGSNITLSQSVNGASGSLSLYAPTPGAGGAKTISRFANLGPYTSAALGLQGSNNGTMIIFPLNPINQFDGNMTLSTLLMDVSLSSANTSAFSWTMSFGIYTPANSTALSLLYLASTSSGAVATSNNTTGWHGLRFLSFHSSQFSNSASNTTTPTFADGSIYYGAIVCKSGGQTKGLSWVGLQFEQTNQRSGTLGAASQNATSLQHFPFVGVYSSGSLPPTITRSSINAANASAGFIPSLVFENVVSAY